MREKLSRLFDFEINELSVFVLRRAHSFHFKNEWCDKFRYTAGRYESSGNLCSDIRIAESCQHGTKADSFARDRIRIKSP